MLKKKKLENVSPYFKINETRIIYHETVTKISRDNKQKIRILIVSNIGIYLIKDFKNAVKPGMFINFIDLKFIFAKKKICCLGSSKNQIRFKSDNLDYIAFLIYHVRVSLFMSNILHIDYEYEYSDGFNETDVIESLNFKCTFADRFLASCNIFCIDSNKIFIGNNLNVINGKFVIHKGIVDENILQPLVFAFAFESSLRTLVLKELDVIDILTISPSLFSESSFISKVKFIKCTFSGDPDFLDSKFHFGVAGISFEDCDICSNNFLNFIEFLAMHSSPIAEISFVNCQCRTDSVSTITQLILFNDVFHKLKKIKFSDIHDCPNLLQSLQCILFSSWALDKDCLYYIVVNNCDIDIADMIDILNQNQSISCLKFSNLKLGRSFTASTISSLETLVLKNCEIDKSITPEFIEMLKCSMIQNLELNSLTTDMDVFLSKLSHVQIKKLTYFSFDNNVLDAKQQMDLINFLDSNLTIKKLGISCVFDMSLSSISIIKLTAVLKKLELVQLSIRGDGTLRMAIGPLMEEILAHFKKTNTLRSLDVTDQRIGLNCMHILSSLACSSLVEIYFDNCYVPTLEALIYFCNKCYTSQHLKFSKWPYNEMERLSRNIPSYSDKDALLKLANDTKDLFDQKFDPNLKVNKCLCETNTKKAIDELVNYDDGNAILGTIDVSEFFPNIFSHDPFEEISPGLSNEEDNMFLLKVEQILYDRFHKF